jgi:hypothetical protein
LRDVDRSERLYGFQLDDETLINEQVDSPFTNHMTLVPNGHGRLTAERNAPGMELHAQGFFVDRF